MACSYTGKLCACVSAQNCRCPRCWRLIWNQFPFTKHQPAPLGKRNKVDADQQSRALRQIFDIFPVTNHSEYKQLFVVKCLSYLGVFIVSSHRLNPSDRLSKVNWGSNIMAACHSQTRFIFPQWSSGKSPLRHAPVPIFGGEPRHILCPYLGRSRPKSVHGGESSCRRRWAVGGASAEPNSIKEGRGIPVKQIDGDQNLKEAKRALTGTRKRESQSITFGNISHDIPCGFCSVFKSTLCWTPWTSALWICFALKRFLWRDNQNPLRINLMLVSTC